MSSEHIYRYFNANHDYKPTKFDIVGGIEPVDYITDFADLSESDLNELNQYTSPERIGGSDSVAVNDIIIIGAHDIPSGFIKSASTAEDRLLKMFGKFNTKIYRPMEKVKIIKIKTKSPTATKKSRGSKKDSKKEKNVSKRSKGAKQSRKKQPAKRSKGGRYDSDESETTNVFETDEMLGGCMGGNDGSDSDATSVESDSSNSDNNVSSDNTDNTDNIDKVFGGIDYTDDTDDTVVGDNVISDEEDAAAFESLVMAGGYNNFNDIEQNNHDDMDLSQFLI